MNCNEILNILLPYSIPNKNNDISLLNINLLWENFLIFENKNSLEFSYIYPYFVELYRKFPELKFNKPKIVEDIINNFNNNEENKLFNVIQIFSFLPFINEIEYPILFNSISEFFSIYFKNNDKLPLNFINKTFQEGSLEFSEKIYEILFNNFLNGINSENFTGYLFIYSFIFDIFLDFNFNIFNELINIIKNFLKKSKIDQLISLFSLTKITEFLIDEEFIIPSNLFSSLLPLFISKDEDIFYQSHKTMKKLLSLGLFNKKENMGELIKQYSKYNIENIKYFFKFFQIILDNGELIEPTNIQPIIDLLGILSIKSNPIIQSYCLEIYSSLTSISLEFCEDKIDSLIDLSLELLKTKDLLIYSKIISFLSIISNIIPETFPIILKDFIPQILLIYNEENYLNNNKFFLEISQSLSIMIEGGTYLEISNKIFEFLLKITNNIQINEIFSITTIIIVLKKQIPNNLSEKIYLNIINFLKNTLIINEFNTGFKLLKKLIVHCNLNSELIYNNIIELLNGNFQILYNIK